MNSLYLENNTFSYATHLIVIFKKASGLKHWRPLDSRTKLDWGFSAYSQKLDTLESFMLLFFTTKHSYFWCKKLSPLQITKLKTSYIWQLVSVTTIMFSLKHVVAEWRRLSRFPAKITLVQARASLKYWENLVLLVVFLVVFVVVLVSSKGLYYLT